MTGRSKARAAVMAVSLAMAAAAHAWATYARGYEAIGGEIFVLMLPAIGVLIDALLEYQYGNDD